MGRVKAWGVYKLEEVSCGTSNGLIVGVLDQFLICIIIIFFGPLLFSPWFSCRLKGDALLPRSSPGGYTGRQRYGNPSPLLSVWFSQSGLHFWVSWWSPLHQTLIGWIGIGTPLAAANLEKILKGGLQTFPCEAIINWAILQPFWILPDSLPHY